MESFEQSDAGRPIWQGTFLPFEQEWKFTPSTATAAFVGDPDNPQLTTNHYKPGSPAKRFSMLGWKFTGKERDAESNLDYFGARYFSSTQGRWMSPDWADKPEPVPYADLSDPQSLNLYSYVRNNPMSRRDADGHSCAEAISCSIEIGAGIGTFIEPGGGTAVGAGAGLIVGAVIDAGLGSYLLYRHFRDGRTSQDELPRDKDGKPIPDAEATGAAHTQLGTRQSKSKPGTSYPQAREFDKDGNPVKDIDHTDHGRKDHTNPHQHRYDPNTGKRLPQEPVIPAPPPPPPPPTPPKPEAAPKG